MDSYVESCSRIMLQLKGIRISGEIQVCKALLSYRTIAISAAKPGRVQYEQPRLGCGSVPCQVVGRKPLAKDCLCLLPWILLATAVKQSPGGCGFNFS